MKSLLRFLSVFVLTCIFASNAWATKPKILLFKDLEPGTEAIGFSVFKGAEPEPFDVVLSEIIDYMGNSLILSRVSGGPMDTPLEEIGAISGMSGSPVFIGDCKDLEECITKAPLDGNNVFLVGSTSYGPGSFIKGGPNFLLTPAEYMLGARASGYVAVSDFYSRMPNEIIVKGQKYFNLLLFPKMENVPVAGNSNGRCKESVKSDIKPGSMISVNLATGDFNLGATGTVTWRDGDNIYAFGHPFNGTGVVAYPFVQITVADTLQTPLGASKLPGCSLDTKGVILVDGAFEVAGTIGGTAPMLPYQVELHMGNGSATLHEEIAASPMAQVIIQLLPQLWAKKLLGDLSYLSVAYQMRITIKNQPEIFVKDFVPVPISENPLVDIFNNIYHPLQALEESGFNYGVESVKVHLDVVKDFELWRVKKSFLSQKKANPGETVYANIILEEYFGSATKQISIPIKVPEDFLERIKSGNPPDIVVLVQSGNKFTDKREQAEVTSLEDLIKQLNQSMNRKTNVLYIQQIMLKGKAEQETDEASSKTAVKPAWKWTDVGEGDIRQFPSNNKNDVSLVFSPPLNGFIDLNLKFSFTVQAKDVLAKEKKETKHRKWFWLF